MSDYMQIATRFPFFALVVFRFAGIMMLAPVFGSRNIPVRVRILLAIVMAAAVTPVVPLEGLSLPATVPGYAIAVLSEITIGLVLGFAASIAFVGVQLGGHLIGQQMGLTMANVIDPLSNQQVSVIQQIQFFFAITMFILVNGHHMLITAIVGSFRVIPLMGLRYRPEMLQMLGDDMFGEMFIVAIKVSAPAVAALMLTSVAMAFIARTVPEMNIFNIGFAIRLAMGLIVAALTVPGLAHLLGNLFDGMSDNLDTLIRMMAT